VLGSGSSISASLSSGNHVNSARLENAYGVPGVIDHRQVTLQGSDYPNIQVQSPREGDVYKGKGRRT
jgi:hypothetical protein